MKTFLQILHTEYGTEDEMQYILARLSPEDIQKCVDEFATSIAQDALDRAAESAMIEHFYYDGEKNGEKVVINHDKHFHFSYVGNLVVFKPSITSTEIILP